MTIATCFRCGEAKFGAWTKCAKCGRTPETPEERTASLALIVPVPRLSGIVTIEQGKPSWLWAVIAAVVFGIAVAYQLSRRTKLQ